MMTTQFALASGLPWNERVSTALTVTLQGMLTIFCVLALLWGAIELMHCLMPRKNGEKTKEKIEKPAKEKKPKRKPEVQASEGSVPTPNEQDAAVAAAIAASLAAYEDSGATVAAIVAAISAARAESGEEGGFRVVSFKRAETRKRRRGF